VPDPFSAPPEPKDERFSRTVQLGHLQRAVGGCDLPEMLHIPHLFASIYMTLTWAKDYYLDGNTGGPLGAGRRWRSISVREVRVAVEWTGNAGWPSTFMCDPRG
jgi:hypothetical protein